MVARLGGEEGGEVQLQQVQVHAVHLLLRVGCPVVEEVVEGLEGLKVEEVEVQHRQAEAVHRGIAKLIFNFNFNSNVSLKMS